ncbi:thiamine biosynthesis protein ApbE [Kosmotoga arenicorallina S304]|uniref:FAD:protein FMN transferase n=1 Tax=Kosmotoga arenicorallina S304 TaxID=1453497 RepID=A0A176K055_9BACT|nr:FAD:protein FMN transferase [Kosmotoga arenicorallina]OAA29720.1 thiamine biosynthesis protein ApbE [Kosmotoga arenicorallina S304]
MRQRNSRNPLSSSTFLYTILALLAISILTWLFITNDKKEYYTKTDYLLGTYVTVRVNSDKTSPVLLANAAFKEIKRIDEKYGSTRGIVETLNSSRGNWVEIDQETAFLLKSALEVSKNTGGAFDPTLYPIIKLWGFDDIESEKHVPSRNDIEEALAKVGYKNIEISPEGDRVRLLNGAQIDLSGIAKGYAVDMAILKIKSIDEKATGFIDAGGDIGIIGPKFGSRPWVIGIRHPRSENGDKVIDYVYMYDGSIATSGDYERFFEVDDVRYHHIFDPSTGFPANNGVISSTVIHKSAMLADAYATAAFVLGDSPGVTFFPRYGALAFLVRDDLSIFKNKGFEVYLSK